MARRDPPPPRLDRHATAGRRSASAGGRRPGPAPTPHPARSSRRCLRLRALRPRARAAAGCGHRRGGRRHCCPPSASSRRGTGPAAPGPALGPPPTTKGRGHRRRLAAGRWTDGGGRAGLLTVGRKHRWVRRRVCRWSRTSCCPERDSQAEESVGSKETSVVGRAPAVRLVHNA